MDFDSILLAKQLNGGGGGSGMSGSAKQALLDCFAKVAWTDGQGQTYYNNLENALNRGEDKGVVSISAVYTQSSTIYDTDTLSDLRGDLVVTATYEDTSTETVTTYTLSGTLEEGTSVITVSYGGKTTTFNVTVKAGVPSGYTRYDYLTKTSGKKDAVNTGLYYNPSFAVLDLDFEFEVTGTGSSANQQGLGLRETDATKTDNFALFFGQGTDNITFRSQILGSNSQIDVGTTVFNQIRKCSYRYNNGTPYFTVDGGEPVYMPNPPSSIATNNTYPLWLCGLNNGHNDATYSDASSGRVRWGRVTFSSGGNKVYDFIPASNGSKAGYFEKVNNNFYPSIGDYISGGNY